MAKQTDQSCALLTASQGLTVMTVNTAYHAPCSSGDSSPAALVICESEGPMLAERSVPQVSTHLKLHLQPLGHLPKNWLHCQLAARHLC